MPVTNGILLTSSTAMVPFLRRAALCSTRRVNAPARRIAFMVSYRAPGSSAGLPEYLTLSPASVLTVMTRSSASLSTVDWLVPELIERKSSSDEPLPRQNAWVSPTRRRQEPKPLGQQCPFPGLGKLDQDTRANLH